MNKLKSFTNEEILALPSRPFASKDDEPMGSSDHRGDDPSSNAIGGYYGIAWHSVFQDTITGEMYKVYCTDGVNGGVGPYEPGNYPDRETQLKRLNIEIDGGPLTTKFGELFEK